MDKYQFINGEWKVQYNGTGPFFGGLCMCKSCKARISVAVGYSIR